MQQKLVLYIGNVTVYTDAERVDQFKDESVSFTQTIQNVKDIKKIFTEFTKTFSLPASKKNNTIFKHYYNYDIADGFDARVKVNAALELNNIPYKTGKIALTGVDLKNNVPHTYKVTFYGDTVNLKDILGDDQLSNLTELSILDTDYNYSTVLAAMQNEYLGNLIVPLITHTDRATYNSSIHEVDYGNLFYSSNGAFADNGLNFTQFKYALRLQAIISAIELQYPDITFSDDFFNDTSNTDFYNLYMWLHRKKGDVEPTEQVQRVYNTSSDFQETSNNGNPRNSIIQSGSLRLQLNYPSETPNQNNGFTSVTLSFVPTQQTVDYSVRVFNLASGSVEVGGFVNQQGNQTIDFDNDLDNMGLYVVQIACKSTIEFAIGKIEWYVRSVEVEFNPVQQITSIYRYSNASAFTTNLTIQFNILEQIPKMKIIDFLTGLFQMFNLTAYVENDIIVVQPLDDFYSKAPTLQGQVVPVNIDKYLDTTKSSVDIALPFSKINFTYKGVKTFLAQQFNQLNNKVWGSSSYSLDGDIYDTPSTEYKIEIPFEHMMYERLVNQRDGSNTDIQYGYFVDDNKESYIGEPLIFYKYRIASGTNIAIRDLANNKTSINNYYIPMNSKDINSSTSKVNIHFDGYINEYNANSNANATAFTDSLFQTQYSNYINEVFSPTRRLTKVTAYLPYKIFSSLQLYDRIEIGQKYYKINSMTTNLTTGKTEFELLNCDL
jgi:hypothetical protein